MRLPRTKAPPAKKPIARYRWFEPLISSVKLESPSSVVCPSTFYGNFCGKSKAFLASSVIVPFLLGTPVGPVGRCVGGRGVIVFPAPVLMKQAGTDRHRPTG